MKKCSNCGRTIGYDDTYYMPHGIDRNNPEAVVLCPDCVFWMDEEDRADCEVCDAVFDELEEDEIFDEFDFDEESNLI